MRNIVRDNDKGKLAIFEIINLKEGDSLVKTFSRNEIAFLTKGKLRFTFRDFPEFWLNIGDFVFLAVGGLFRYTVEQDSEVIIMRLSQPISSYFSHDFRIDNLFDAKTDSQLNHLRNNRLYTLKANETMWRFVESIQGYLADEIKYAHLFDTKLYEFFDILKNYYRKDELQDFLFLILSGDTAFSEFVRANYRQYKTAHEIAEAMHFSPQKFGKKFKEIFGTSVYQWMMQERSFLIRQELITGEKSIKQIAAENNYSSSQLWSFCKNVFNKTPSQIREEAKRDTLTPQGRSSAV